MYTVIFHGCKNENFPMKKSNIFLLFAQNINCGYTLEPPHLCGSNEYPNLCFRAKIRKNLYPCKPQFYYIKVGCKGVYNTRTCYHDGLNAITETSPFKSDPRFPPTYSKNGGNLGSESK